MQERSPKIYIVTDMLHIFPMVAAWTYVPIPTKKIPNVPRGGWGSIPVIATVGKTEWRTSLFPIKGKRYFIPIKKIVCKKEGLTVGDKVKVSYVVIDK